MVLPSMCETLLVLEEGASSHSTPATLLSFNQLQLYTMTQSSLRRWNMTV